MADFDDIFKKTAEKYNLPKMKEKYTPTKLNPGRDVSKFDTRTITEKGVFSPKSVASTVGKAAKATRYGKIALGVAAAGLAAKEFLKSKMNKEPKDVDKKSTGGMMIGKGKDYIKDLL